MQTEMTKLKLNTLIDDVCLIILTSPLWITVLMFIYMAVDAITIILF